MTPETIHNNTSVDKELLLACSKGLLSEVNELINNKDADPCFHDTDSNGASPLIEAAKHGHAEVVAYLLSEGAPWNALDMAGKCAGDYAMDNGHTEAAELLLNTGKFLQQQLLQGVE
jgi:type IV protein arginine methyltransferase